MFLDWKLCGGGRTGRFRLMEEPRINRSITLHFKGDWGQANLHRVCGWLSQEFADCAGPRTRCAIWNGRGGTDAVLAVGHGEVDVALATPAAFAAMGLDGRGPFTGTMFPELRALGSVPQRDRLVFAVSAGCGVSTVEEVVARRLPLRIATGANDGVNFIGFAAQALLAAVGVGRATLESWGGEVLEDERPFPCLQWLAEGRANAIVQEAVMMPQWQRMAEAQPLSFLAIPNHVLAYLDARFGWPRATIEAGYFPGQREAFETLDFSDFVVLCRADMPEDVAHLLAWCMGETGAALEAQYRHMPPAHSPVSYPLDPVQMGRTRVPLHPGAARYYEQLTAAGSTSSRESRPMIWA